MKINRKIVENMSSRILSKWINYSNLSIKNRNYKKEKEIINLLNYLKSFKNAIKLGRFPLFRLKGKILN